MLRTNKQTDKETDKITNTQTDKQTDLNILPTPTDRVGVGNKWWQWRVLWRIITTVKFQRVTQNMPSCLAYYLLQCSRRQPVSSNIDDVIRSCHHRNVSIFCKDTCIHGIIVALSTTHSSSVIKLITNYDFLASGIQYYKQLSTVSRHNQFSNW